MPEVAALASFAPSKPFVYASLGSIAGEVVIAFRLVSMDGPWTGWPERYRRPMFYCLHAAIAVLAGMLVEGYGVQSLIAAFHIGITTPVLVEQLGRLPTPVRLPEAGDHPRS